MSSSETNQNALNQFPPKAQQAEGRQAEGRHAEGREPTVGPSRKGSSAEASDRRPVSPWEGALGRAVAEPESACPQEGATPAQNSARTASRRGPARRRPPRVRGGDDPRQLAIPFDGTSIEPESTEVHDSRERVSDSPVPPSSGARTIATGSTLPGGARTRIQPASPRAGSSSSPAVGPFRIETPFHRSSDENSRPWAGAREAARCGGRRALRVATRLLLPTDGPSSKERAPSNEPLGAPALALSAESPTTVGWGEQLVVWSGVVALLAVALLTA